MEFKSAREWLLSEKHRERILREVSYYLGYGEDPDLIVEAILMILAGNHPVEGDGELIMLPGLVTDEDGLPFDAGAIYRVSDLPMVLDLPRSPAWDRVELEDIRDMATETRRKLFDAGKGFPAPVAIEEVREPMSILCTAETAARLLCHCVPARLRARGARIPPMVTAMAEGDEMTPEALYIQYKRCWEFVTLGTLFLLWKTLKELKDALTEMRDKVE